MNYAVSASFAPYQSALQCFCWHKAQRWRSLVHSAPFFRSDWSLHPALTTLHFDQPADEQHHAETISEGQPCLMVGATVYELSCWWSALVAFEKLFAIWSLGHTLVPECSSLRHVEIHPKPVGISGPPMKQKQTKVLAGPLQYYLSDPFAAPQMLLVCFPVPWAMQVKLQTILYCLLQEQYVY